MRLEKRRLIKYSCLLLSLFVLTGCHAGNQAKDIVPKDGSRMGGTQKELVKFEVNPEEFSLSISNGKQLIPVSLPGGKRRVEDFTEKEEETSWRYPEEEISVSIKAKENYLHVTIASEAEGGNEFAWPSVAGETYYMPFGEGKRIPAADKTWKKYLNGNEFDVMEQLSMPFWASASGETAVLYIMENPFRSSMIFSKGETIGFQLLRQYPEIDPDKQNSFRIYLTQANPVSAAKIYRAYRKELGEFVTLEEKAGKNPDIRKLYGAPHIYLWGENLISPEDIHWPAFRKALGGGILKEIAGFAKGTEAGADYEQAIQDIAGQDYVDAYQKNVICRFLSEVLQREDFYNPERFPVKDKTMKALEKKGMENRDASRLLTWNKHALAANLSEAFRPAEEWMNGETVDIIRDLKAAGLDRAFIGLNSWEQAYAKPALIETAVEKGYLIGPYDSYHSIHEPGKEQWITAKFEDKTLYENASIRKKNGEMEEGFKKVGRKLNPVLSLPSVKQRVEKIVSAGIAFNAWFIDCDATGEIYDDYTPEHITTKQEDLKARLERMAYIRDTHNMVIGSEGGNDFAASTIAFAHGIELKSFSWMDEDMKNHKESEYYIGRYYNPSGGVAEHFSKRIPLKEQYDTLFADPRYDLPLYKLVYNDSMITSYHWDWSTFKIKGRTQDRMLREILYNTPPLYHLDRTEWEKYGRDIAAHTRIWSEFSRQAVMREMTDFKYLTADGSVQLSQYGGDITVAANFSDEPFSYEGEEIPGHSLLLLRQGERLIYTPDIADNNR